VWLAAVKLESESSEFERARLLLSKARDRAGTARVWMKSAKLERLLAKEKAGLRNEERKLIDDGLVKFPEFYKLWLMKAELLADEKKFKEARETYKEGVKHCPSSVHLWLAYAKFEVATSGAHHMARSILETARLRNAKNPQLWLAAMRTERQAENLKVAQQLLAKALQECPTAGVLWSHAIATDPRPVRKARSYDALKRCTDDPYVFCAVAKLFWLDRKIRKARNWFNRAVTVDPDLGDVWAYFYKFESEQGSKMTQEAIIKRVMEADPRHGELWTAITKHDRLVSLTSDEVLKIVSGNIKDIFAEPGN